MDSGARCDRPQSTAGRRCCAAALMEFSPAAAPLTSRHRVTSAGSERWGEKKKKKPRSLESASKTKLDADGGGIVFCCLRNPAPTHGETPGFQGTSPGVLVPEEEA
ncbi:unnamed protein product [Pleuronectes platessa]|uniref:Uncharacterized protein n=1 Tax=Pleuronectes platessa TaxID=8262 RepID=A0A9N7TMZ3_PLEPL|nr:unnamed protein product [Pleuronectes platessa]